MDAANTVFAIPELLESILLSIPPEDILLGALVNKSWQTIITQSSALLKHIDGAPWPVDNPEWYYSFVFLKFDGGKLLIRRLPNGTEIEAMLFATSSLQPTELVIFDDEDDTVKFEDVAGEWRVQYFSNKIHGLLHVIHVTHGALLSRYLDRYHDLRSAEDRRITSKVLKAHPGIVRKRR